MKFTLSWLKDHLETDATLDEIERVLSSIGLEVEGIENPAETLGAFTVARIVEAKKHPNADKLQVCQVEIEPGQPTVEVVCGAPNAKAGLIGVFGPIGSYIPGTGITLEKRPVRGVDSNGMMLSERELDLSDDHAGIIELDTGLADNPNYKQTQIIVFNDKPQALERLVQLLRVKPENVIQQPDPNQPADIMVILGEDYDPCR